MPNRYRLKGASLEEIRRKAEAQHGPAARIVSAERVTSPGIAGFFAGHRYEAMVEVLPEAAVVSGEILPEPELLEGESGQDTSEQDKDVPAEDGVQAAAGGGTPHQLTRSAIAALLEEADAEESRMHGPGEAAGFPSPAPAASTVSTESRDFAGLLEQLGAEYQMPPAGRVKERPARSGQESAADRLRQGPVPVPLKGAGDLVVMLGLGRDAIETAVGMSIASGGADVRTAGELSAYGHLHVDGRLSATAARAQAVLTGQTVLVAFGLGKQADVETRLPLIRSLAADQVWLVVDAGRKPEDTAAWARKVADSLPVAGLAVTGAGETLTPATVNDLGIPVGWVDGAVPLQPFL
jgi:hypothetical protein